MTIHFDYKTAAATDNYFEFEQKNIFVVSYVIIVGFHSHLNSRKIVAQRSYGHSINQLTSIDCLSEDVY